MKNEIVSFAVGNAAEFKGKMLNWLRRFNIFCFLDNHNYTFEDAAFKCLVAAGSSSSIGLHKSDLYNPLKAFCAQHPGWIFGHFNYPSHTAPDNTEVQFADGFFFVPEVVIRLQENRVYFELYNRQPTEIFEDIIQQQSTINNTTETNAVIKSRYSRDEYFAIISELKKHLQRGDCYEINFCLNFYSQNAAADPFFLYQQLSVLSPNPFAAFYRLGDKFCLCASPERFLKKTGTTIISQPIKGTSRRDFTDPVTDEANKQYLKISPKERSENVMIVDLMRNDLSRICLEGSVTVKELFGVYTFPQVHQLISTITGEVDEKIPWPDIIAACFPMGSMTGAPKIKVMELIERYELTNRNLFSGTIGYITPNADFDFNVVIRSLFFDKTKKIFSFSAGSGITFHSNAEEEYLECMLKAGALKKILENNNPY